MCVLDFICVALLCNGVILLAILFMLHELIELVRDKSLNINVYDKTNKRHTEQSDVFEITGTEKNPVF